MSDYADTFLLAKALEEKLITANDATELLLERESDASATFADRLVAKGLISHEQSQTLMLDADGAESAPTDLAQTVGIEELGPPNDGAIKETRSAKNPAIVADDNSINQGTATQSTELLDQESRSAADGISSARTEHLAEPDADAGQHGETQAGQIKGVAITDDFALPPSEDSEFDPDVTRLAAPFATSIEPKAIEPDAGESEGETTIVLDRANGAGGREQSAGLDSADGATHVPRAPDAATIGHEEQSPNSLADVARAKRSASGGTIADDATIGPDSQHAASRGSGNAGDDDTDMDGAAVLSAQPTLAGKHRYVLMKELARGGLGAVWLGHDQHIARDVAIKEMLPKARKSPEIVERFYEEAQVTGQLEHPGIVPIYELGVKADGSPFYSMKLLRGRCFSDLIDAFHKLPVNDAERDLVLHDLLNVFVDVCNAMAYAHSRGVLHRDLKPLNIMVGDYGEAIVVDWGLAKIIDAPETQIRTSTQAVSSGSQLGSMLKSTDGSSSQRTIRSTMRSKGSETVAGRVMGTPAYMSPEQAMGKMDELDARSDIFALGAILYEILVGKAPFIAPDAYAILTKVVAGIFTPPRKANGLVAPELNAICLKAMALQPEDRYESAKDLAEDVKRFQAQEPVAAYPEPLHRRMRRWARRHRTAVVSTAAVLFVLMNGLIGFKVYDDRQLADRAETVRTALVDAQSALDADDFSQTEEAIGRAEAMAATDIRLADLAHHTADLRRRLEQTRVRNLADKVTALVDQGNQFFEQRNILESLQRYDEARTLLNADPILVRQNDALAQLRRQVDQRYAAADQWQEEQDQQRASVARRQQFDSLRQEALVHGSLFTGTDLVTNLQQAVASAEEALALYEASVADDGSISINDPFVTDERDKVKIREGCYELLLVLAEAKSNPALPGSQSRQQAVTAALELLDRADRLGLQTRAYHQRRAKYLEVLGRANEARTEDKLANNVEPALALDYYLLGIQQYNIDDFTKAIEFFDSALRANPQHFFSRYFKALCYVRTDRMAEAVTSLTAVLAQDPDFEWAYSLRGFAYGALGNAKASEADLQKALRLHPKSFAVHHNYSAARFQQAQREFNETGHWNKKLLAEATTLTQQAIDLAPSEFQPYMNLSEINAALGDFDKALANATKAIELASPMSKHLACNQRALVYMARQVALGKNNPNLARQDLQSALGDFVAAIQSIPQGDKSVANYYIEVARIFYAQRQFEQALQACNQALAVNAERAPAHKLRGETLLKLADLYAAKRDAAAEKNALIEAVEALSQSLKLGEPNDLVYFERGQARARLGDKDLAMQDYDRAIELAPASWEWRSKRGWGYLNSGIQIALTDFEHAIKVNDRNADAFNGRGYARVLLGDYRNAAADAEHAVELDSGPWQIIYNAACIYSQAFGKVAQDEQAPGRVELQKKYLDRAIELTNRAIEKIPVDSRGGFVQQTVVPEKAFDPIRTQDAFTQLVTKYSPPSK